MEGFAQVVARFIRAAHNAYGRKWSFLGLSLCAFAVSVFTLAALDLLPDAPRSVPAPEVTVSASPLVSGTAASVPSTELPVKISIPTIDLSATVSNPDSTNVTILDNALLSGAVRYPTSAKLGETGNVVLFGHSSYLPVVNNLAYKTFNGIQKLKAGDTITVYSAGTAYTYAVRTVAKESANSGAIPLNVDGKVLTLSTCNSFATKNDRFVVTADFVESHSLGA